MPRSTRRPPEIISLGEPLVEFSATENGPLAEVTHFQVGTGGDTANFAVAVSRLGGRAGYVTRLGGDPFGDILIRCWEAEGVDHAGTLRDPAAATGIYFSSREGAQHHFTYYRRDSAASRLCPDDLPADYIRQARWLHVSGISQAISPSAARAVEHAVGLAREAGLVVSYDPNLRLKLWSLDRAREMLCTLIERVDVFMPSHEDARHLTGLEAPEAIVRHYLAMGAPMVVLKLGAEGALLAAAASGGEGAPRIKHFKGLAVQAVDASGAGDTFDAAFAVAYLEGRPPAECVRFANAAAALVTTGVGTITPIPSRAEVEILMKDATQKNP